MNRNPALLLAGVVGAPAVVAIVLILAVANDGSGDTALRTTSPGFTRSADGVSGTTW